MNCDCISEIKERMLDMLPTKAEYANMKITSIDFDGECFLYGENRMVSALSIPVTIHHEPIGRKKQTKTNLTISYCPFCGEKQDKGD